MRSVWRNALISLMETIWLFILPIYILIEFNVWVGFFLLVFVAGWIKGKMHDKAAETADRLSRIAGCNVVSVEHPGLIQQVQPVGYYWRICRYDLLTRPGWVGMKLRPSLEMRVARRRLHESIQERMNQ